MRILMSMFGWNDSGGGTILPRLTALELRRRGHEVLVVYSAVPQIQGAGPYAIREHSDEGVQLVGIHNRPALFLDDKHPEREVEDPRCVQIFKHYFDSFQPDIVHYHNFLGLSLGITQWAHAAGLPSFYTPYNFWLLCPTLYLNLPDLSLCQGVNPSGSNCLACTRAPRPGQDYVARRDQLRARYQAQVGPCLASSECVRDLLLANGYAAEQVEILKFANQRAAKIWSEVGATRRPGVNPTVHIGFTGSVIPIKGVHVLVAAAQLLRGDFKITIYGEAAPEYQRELERLDTHERIHFAGFFANEDHSRILSELDLAVVPSVCYDHSPLVIGEFLAARVPVVGAEIGGIPDYIPPGCGALFQAGQPESLAQVLQALIDHPERIAEMQAQIEAPLSFDDYVSILEARYERGLQNQDREQQRRRLRHFLQQRGSALFYHPQKCVPLPALQDASPFALDINAESVAQVSAAQLQKAQWISYSDPLLLEQLGLNPEDLAPTAVFLPRLQRLNTSEQNLNLSEGFEQSFLLPLLEGGEWPLFLEAYLSSQSAGQLCVLMPLGQSLEQAQDTLLDWLQAEKHDTDSGPELMLIEAATTAAELQQLLRHCTSLLLGSTALKQPLLREQLVFAPHITSETRPSLGAISWQQAACPEAFALRPELQGWTRNTSLEDLQTQNLTLLTETLESLNI